MDIKNEVKIDLKIEIELKDKQLYLPIGKILLFKGVVKEVNISEKGTFLLIDLLNFAEDNGKEIKNEN